MLRPWVEVEVGVGWWFGYGGEGRDVGCKMKMLKWNVSGLASASLKVKGKGAAPSSIRFLFRAWTTRQSAVNANLYNITLHFL